LDGLVGIFTGWRSCRGSPCNTRKIERDVL
jgi:hypothetical protein